MLKRKLSFCSFVWLAKKKTTPALQKKVINLVVEAGQSSLAVWVCASPFPTDGKVV